MNSKIFSLLVGLSLTATAAPIPDYAEADLVLGHANFTSFSVADPPTAASLNAPTSVVVDPVTKKVFVADSYNYRILRYASAAGLTNGATAEFAFGQNSLTAKIDSGSGGISPNGLFIDALGRLWVADSSHNRVLMFTAASTRTNSTPDKIFGQPNATTVTSGITAAKMSDPNDVCVDSADRLWVADAANHRVLRFDAISGKASGASADGVLGQVNFTTGTFIASGANKLQIPSGVTVSSGGALYVTCIESHRVLRFDNAAALANGVVANAVLGQPNYVTVDSGQGAQKMQSPSGAWITADDSLWVADKINRRLLRFNNASTKSSGAAADGVLGQQDFISGGFSNTSSRSFGVPQIKPFVDPEGRVWIADRGTSRVLRFTPPGVVIVPPIVVPPVIPPVVPPIVVPPIVVPPIVVTPPIIAPPAVDQTAPLLVLSSKVPKLSVKNFIILKGTASDSSGVMSVQYRISTGPLKLATGTTAWQIKATLKKGLNTVTLFATDTAGNVSPSRVLKIKRQ